jgi:hypothetical protein
MSQWLTVFTKRKIISVDPCAYYRRLDGLLIVEYSTIALMPQQVFLEFRNGRWNWSLETERIGCCETSSNPFLF